ncbi:uncharacterized protein PAC_00983 [Phialocephala subalpina]|uniref:Uncharacterized protein n=1 Tax=Phialocephala subalpina TaxID=576137 RepID=A0A1L7WEE2_9HELO|nr:uncharacterized protein PAC_00983 [Phialocephala subalpina]
MGFWIFYSFCSSTRTETIVNAWRNYRWSYQRISPSSTQRQSHTPASQKVEYKVYYENGVEYCRESKATNGENAFHKFLGLVGYHNDEEEYDRSLKWVWVSLLVGGTEVGGYWAEDSDIFSFEKYMRWSEIPRDQRAEYSKRRGRPHDSNARQREHFLDRVHRAAAAEQRTASTLTNQPRRPLLGTALQLHPMGPSDEENDADDEDSPMGVVSDASTLERRYQVRTSHRDLKRITQEQNSRTGQDTAAERSVSDRNHSLDQDFRLGPVLGTAIEGFVERAPEPFAIVRNVEERFESSIAAQIEVQAARANTTNRSSATPIPATDNTAMPPRTTNYPQSAAGSAGTRRPATSNVSLQPLQIPPRIYPAQSPSRAPYPGHFIPGPPVPTLPDPFFGRFPAAGYGVDFWVMQQRRYMFERHL